MDPLTMALGLWLFAAAAMAPEPPPPLEGISRAEYVRVWPSLAECFDANDFAKPPATLTCAASLIGRGVAIDGALNLRAQVLRQSGSLDAAAAAMADAIARQPQQALHYYQDAQIVLTRIAASSNPLTRWRLSKVAYARFEKAHSLSSSTYAYIRYLTVFKLSAPTMAGGDPDGALALADTGIAEGCRECYILRGYVHLVQGRQEQGWRDLDEAVTIGADDDPFFARVGAKAAELKAWTRAAKYYRYAVDRQPGNSRWQCALGEAYVGGGDLGRARVAFTAALQIDPGYARAATQLERLKP